MSDVGHDQIQLYRLCQEDDVVTRKALCPWCDEAFLVGDVVITTTDNVVHHQECFFRQLFGSVEHQRKGEHGCDRTCHDDPALSYRLAAKAAVEEYSRRHAVGETNLTIV